VVEIKAPGGHIIPNFDVGEVMFAPVMDEYEYDGSACALLCPSFFIKDQNKAMYYLPPANFDKAKAEEWDKDTRLLGKKLELSAKASKGSKKGAKKSAKPTKKSKKK
jgi:hypothetical protein